MLLRKYKTSDCEEMAELFYQTVHYVNAKDYTKAQLNKFCMLPPVFRNLPAIPRQKVNAAVSFHQQERRSEHAGCLWQK